jgi:signal transduction histidine kinase
MTPERLEAVLAGREYLEAMCRQVAGEAGVQIALSDRDGRMMLGLVTGPQAARTAVTTRLPWTLHVSSADPGGDGTAADTRRRMLLAGLGILGILILASTYFTFRGIRRELAIARLQSEFVSAVSHEFRTPLTSMRQLSEMLLKGRVISEDRRQQTTRCSLKASGFIASLKALNFGRAETRRYHMVPVELGDLIRVVAAESSARPRRSAWNSLDAAPCGSSRADPLSLASEPARQRESDPDRRTAWVSLSRTAAAR